MSINNNFSTTHIPLIIRIINVRGFILVVNVWENFSIFFVVFLITWKKYWKNGNTYVITVNVILHTLTIWRLGFSIVFCSIYLDKKKNYAVYFIVTSHYTILNFYFYLFNSNYTHTQQWPDHGVEYLYGLFYYYFTVTKKITQYNIVRYSIPPYNNYIITYYL